nr:hypothetical protein [Saprospiraceae bacterium]
TQFETAPLAPEIKGTASITRQEGTFPNSCWILSTTTQVNYLACHASYMDTTEVAVKGILWHAVSMVDALIKQ